MIIEKTETVGYYQIVWKNSPKGYLVAVGDTMQDAIDRLFKKLEWLDIGNWEKK